MFQLFIVFVKSSSYIAGGFLFGVSRAAAVRVLSRNGLAGASMAAAGGGDQYRALGPQLPWGIQTWESQASFLNFQNAGESAYSDRLVSLRLNPLSLPRVPTRSGPAAVPSCFQAHPSVAVTPSGSARSHLPDKLGRCSLRPEYEANTGNKPEGIVISITKVTFGWTT